MTDPRTLSIKDFSYSLPEVRIAKYPLPERDASKLLIYKKNEITEDIYRNITDHVPADSLFIFNDTKVVEARLLFQKPTGGVIEIFCLEPHEQYGDVTNAMMQQEVVLWKCLIGGASKWKHGQILEKKIIQPGNEFILKATYIEKQTDSFVVELSWNHPLLSFAEVLHQAGAIPLPPYIKRNAEPIDAERYQTIYANQDGSVAAPTAGLHFTNHVFNKLKAKNIHKDFVTLHVGAGTFKPVKSETMQEHEMHAEYFTVSRTTIENLIRHLDKNIIAVGTTSLRTLESLYWMGVKSVTGNKQPSSEVSQWEAYDNPYQTISPSEALHSLLHWMEKHYVDYFTAKTQIIIAPGYKFRIVNGLVTNFHQPQSTLLLLVAAFTGNDPIAIGWRNIYQYALQNNFRFLSYGDGSLLWKNQA
jgi:S-adenosylmethionine:tRNA ribosyltransferase-isomerase